ncbi:hypothetical protein SOPP22_18300 [Shewanella sp. OPT22]|nr:hypothetical protein SOPP22_18300 [Shewanella sp. OPT22]
MVEARDVESAVAVAIPDLESKQQKSREQNLTESGRHYTVDSQIKAGFCRKLKIFFDPNDKLPPFWCPRRKVPTDEQVEGLEKKLMAKDDFFVKLKAKKGVTFEERKHKLDQISLALQPYPSCCPCRVLDDTTIIARSGGKDLFTYLHGEEEGEVPINTFKNAAADLKEMHRNRIFLRDIKSENLAISGDKNIFFIDTDEAAIPKLDNYDHSSVPKYTSRMMTAGLYSKREKGNIDGLEAGDSYAMLLTMIESTVKIRSRYALLKTYEKYRNEIPEVTIVNDTNKNFIRKWVWKNIKVAYKEKVLDFLTDPANNSLSLPLYDLISWRR